MKSQNSDRNKTIGNRFLAFAVLMFILWVIAFIGFHAGGFIHSMVVIALIAVMVGMIHRLKALYHH